MRIGTAIAKGANPGDAFPVSRGHRPIAERGGNLQRQLRPIKMGVWVMAMQMGRNLSVLQHQHNLDHPGDPGGGF